MRLGLQIISFSSLVATILPSVLFIAGQITLDQAKWTMLLATIVWFAVTPFWMGQPKVKEEVMI